MQEKEKNKHGYRKTIQSISRLTQIFNNKLETEESGAKATQNKENLLASIDQEEKRKERSKKERRVEEGFSQNLL